METENATIERVNMGINLLRDALKDKVVDPFKVGDVIRWTSADRYSYAAIKTDVGWFTTARPGNPFIPASPLRFETLVEVLAESENNNISVATEWEAL